MIRSSRPWYGSRGNEGQYPQNDSLPTSFFPSYRYNGGRTTRTQERFMNCFVCHFTSSDWSGQGRPTNLCANLFPQVKIRRAMKGAQPSISASGVLILSHGESRGAHQLVTFNLFLVTYCFELPIKRSSLMCEVT